MLECLVIRVWHYLRRIRRYNLVGGTVSLGVGFGVLKAQSRPNLSPFLLPADPVVELSTTLAPCLSVCCHVSNHDDSGLYLLLVPGG